MKRTRPQPSPSRARVALGLSEEQLLPRIGFQLESLETQRAVAMPGSAQDDGLLVEEMSRSVRRGVTRSTRKAMKGYLIETTDLDQRLTEWKDALSRRHAGVDGSPGEAAREKGRVRFDSGFHHLRPALEMRYDVGPGALRVRLDAAGVLKVGYGGKRMAGTSLEASYDGDAALLSCTLGF